ncbi:hypothetical protein ACT4VH_08145 [Acinetobacter baumannii]
MNKIPAIAHTFGNSKQDFNRHPQSNTLISLNDLGEPLSYFGDLIWDLSCYAHIYTQKSLIDFRLDHSSPNKETLSNQIKIILFFIIFSRKRRDNNITLASINNSFFMIRKIAYLCLDFNCDFTKIRKNGLFLKALNNHLVDLSWESKKKYISILNSITKAGMLYKIENFGFDEKYIQEIKNAQLSEMKEHKQTLLIPSRIYAQFITSSLSFFKETLPIINSIHQLLSEDDFYKFKYESTHLKPKFFKNLVDKYHLNEYFNKYKISHNQKLIFFLQSIQSLGGFTLLCFSGMRRSEALNLNYHAYQEVKRRNLPSAWILKGTTSKFTQVGAVATYWVSSSVIQDVIHILQKLAEIHVTWSKKRGYTYDLDIDNYPLFPSFANKHEKAFHPIFKMPLGAFVENFDSIYRNIDPIIFTESDLHELNTFNPLINWLEEYKLEIGKPWRFTPHQFRRSLTVYCARSGLVKIPTLKQQLKHITYDMTLYYGKNYMNAQNVIQHTSLTNCQYETSLIKEYKNQTLYEQLSNFTKDVIQKDTPLFGGEGTRLQVLKEQKKSPIFLTDKKQTEKYIFEGKVAYRKTVLGGCSRVSGCNKLGFSYITACVPCSYSIFNEDSIDALELARDSYSKIAQEKLDNNQPILYEQYIQEVKAVDQLLEKIRHKYIEVKNV